MQKKSRIYFGCLAVTLLVVAVLSIFYASFVLPPSRYPAFERTQTATLQGVYQAVNPTPSPEKPSASASPMPSRSTARDSLATTTDSFRIDPNDPSGFMNALNRIMKTETNANEDDPFDPNDLIKLDNMLSGYCGGMGFIGIGVKGDRSDLKEQISSRVLKDPQVSGAGRYKVLAKNYRLARPVSLGLAIQRKLDGVAKFLAEIPYDKFPDFDHFQGYLDWTISNYVKVVVIRACEREEWDHAVRLLEDYLELAGRIHWASYPEGEPRLFSFGTSIFLAQYERFPENGLFRIQKALDKLHLAPEQIEQFRKAHALRAGKRYKEIRAAGSLPTEYNTWHFFGNSVPERMTIKALAPVLDRQFEEVVMAWVEDDPQEIRRKEIQLEATRRLMNINLNPLRLYYMQEYNPSASLGGVKYLLNPPEKEVIDKVHGEFFNKDVDLNRIIVAALRYRRATGHYPESIEAMTPKYLDASFVDPAASNWMVFRVPVVAQNDGKTSVGLPIDEIPAFCRMQKMDDRRQDYLEVRYPYTPLIPEAVCALVRRK